MERDIPWKHFSKETWHTVCIENKLGFRNRIIGGKEGAMVNFMCLLD